MSSAVSIPKVAGPGTLTCDVVLGPGDARVFIDKLKAWAAGVDRLLQQRAAEKATGSAGAASAASPPTAAPAVAAPPPVAAAPATLPPPVAPAAVPAAAAAAAHAPPPLFPGAVPATSPQRAPRPALPTQPAAVAPPPPRQVSQAAVPPAPQRAAPQAAAATGASWQLCWTSDAGEHNNEAVGSMAYLPQIAGLPGGDGHAGWLISSSRGLLNLWEASPSGGRGEPALMCMHSQGTDYSSVCLDAERSTRMLLSASVDRSGAEWVSAHSLDVESLLAPRGRCPMPHNAQSRITGRNCLSVASLHSFGGPLTETCVAAYGGALVVWHVGTSSKPAASNAAKAGDAAPKALWKAHDALITALHKSPFGLSLFSGDAAGKVHMFNMREKPSRPNAQFAQDGRITGVFQINDSQVLSTAGDGRLMVWDLRNSSAPVKFAVPDGRPIVRAALSPFADSVALATTAGIYSVDLMDSACHVTGVLPSIKSPVTALLWNAATSEVVAAGGAGAPGSISVFKPRMAGY